MFPERKQLISQGVNDSVINHMDSVKLYRHWKGKLASSYFWSLGDFRIVEFQITLPINDTLTLHLYDEESSHKDALSPLYKSIEQLKVGDDVFFDGLFKREYIRNLGYFNPMVSKDLSDLNPCRCGIKFGFLYVGKRPVDFDDEFWQTLEHAKAFYDSTRKYRYDGQGLRRYDALMKSYTNAVYADTLKLSGEKRYYFKRYMTDVFWQTNGVTFTMDF